MKKEKTDDLEILKMLQSSMNEKEIRHCSKMMVLAVRLEEALLQNQKLRTLASDLNVSNVIIPLESVTHYYIKAFCGINNIYTDPKSRAHLKHLIKKHLKEAYNARD